MELQGKNVYGDFIEIVNIAGKVCLEGDGTSLMGTSFGKIKTWKFVKTSKSFSDAKFNKCSVHSFCDYIN